ncbi:hypothetical protein FE257_006576 [Aspergillus nanangensis]|uniref:Cytochrome P450 family protein n=1 Tax=Aspergillus nanangensis TaxID=2582783 RepID=A0AAD4GZ79_ASPNN|nr:hypothetical protein FE257_006576 [Aspergillus nanangensis]
MGLIITPVGVKTASWAFYSLLVGPLSSYPGPLFARISPFWVIAQCRRGRRSQAVLDLHKKYGDFVRIAPNHVSIANPAAVQQIYGHKSGFTKGPFYEDKSIIYHSAGQLELTYLFCTLSPS